jgi:hypothetical protein
MRSSSDNRIISLSLLGLLFSLVPVYSVSQSADISHSAQNTFTSGDGSFEIRYPLSFSLCRQPQPDNPQLWTPEDSCMSYIPVCEDAAVACVAYPAGEYNGSNFQAAALSVSEIADAKTENDCLKEDRSIDAKTIHTEIVNGVKFKSISGGEGGLGNFLDKYIYMNVHHGECYRLQVGIASSNYGNYDPGSIKEFTASDAKHVHNSLDRVVRSFRFLK